MVFPACTGFGEATLVTDKFGPVVPTTVVTVAVLFAEFGSIAEELTGRGIGDHGAVCGAAVHLDDESERPDVNPAMLASVQTTLPVPPTAGRRQLHPAGEVIDTNVVFAGTEVDNCGIIRGTWSVVGYNLRIGDVGAGCDWVRRPCFGHAHIGDRTHIRRVGGDIVEKIGFIPAADHSGVRYRGRSRLRHAGDST